MTKRIGWVALSLGLFLSSAIAARGDSATMYLPNCLGIPERKPLEVILACADAGMVATKLHWSQWGGYYAYASGQLKINDCNPNCARGHFQRYTILLTAFGKQRCPNGETAYRAVRYTYQRIYKVPPWSVNGHTYTIKYGPPQQGAHEFPCEPRP